jgi:AcrR family transcriptional regulator
MKVRKMPKQQLSSPTTPTVRPPLQARSQDTMERVVKAASRLMDRRAFDAVSVSEIVGEAGSSVGAFYARFRDKAALLGHLEQLAADEIDEFASRSDEKSASGGPALHAAVSEVVSFLVGFHRRRQGVLRAFTLRDRARMGTSGERTTIDSRMLDLAHVILRKRGEIAHPSPDQAVHLGFAMTLGALRERILFGQQQPGRPPLPDTLLVEELSHTFVSYLMG